MRAEVRVGLEPADNPEVMERMREQARDGLARAMYDAGEHPVGEEQWSVRFARVVIVQGRPDHEDCPEDEADHVVVTLERDSAQ